MNRHNMVHGIPSHSVGKGKVNFSTLCVVPRSQDNDSRGSTTNKALLGIQWN